MPRKRLKVEGIVQGVGFRPSVYRIAVECGLKGYVLNSPEGVIIEVEGDKRDLNDFVSKLESRIRFPARIDKILQEDLPSLNYEKFEIRESVEGKEAGTIIPAEIATCDDCLRELFDPADRRFRYPFINCTNCGPRYTIIGKVPYDRKNTTMNDFPMCADCEREYLDPSNRRFHAEPNACHECGPRVELFDCSFQGIAGGDDAIKKTVDLLKNGKIVAIKGLGGYHLALDPFNDAAVKSLRLRKGRDKKPFAVMARDIESARKLADMNSDEENLLLSPARPIVILKKKSPEKLSPFVAPDNRNLGIMLPYTPLHHLIFDGGIHALVMTSANFSEEPIVIGEADARERLRGLADFVLAHDRRILNRTDDSIVRVFGGCGRFLRRSRGFVPVPVFLKFSAPPVLAVGGELKNTICVTKGDRAYLSQYIGNLENPLAISFFEEAAARLEECVGVRPEIIVHDMHPEYTSTKYALDRNCSARIPVQHHHSHILSVLAEHRLDEPVIGISIDGTGYGLDGNIWGSEVLLVDKNHMERLAHLGYIPLPGGEKAIRENWRTGLAILYTAFGEESYELYGKFGIFNAAADRRKKAEKLLKLMHDGYRFPLSCGMGRYFDGISALLGLVERNGFEGHAPMALEMCSDANIREAYSFVPDGDSIDFSQVIREIVSDILSGHKPSFIGGKFHETVARAFSNVADSYCKKFSIKKVALSGGSFQNKILFERISGLLASLGREVLSNHTVPMNDGGLSLGQAYAGMLINCR